MTDNEQNIFLIGPMGAGKSSIGRVLAELLDRPFYDSDIEIEQRSGVSIAWIFEVEGEAGFREREAAMIKELAHKNGIVLSTGGGAIVTPANREVLKANGFIVYLKVSLSVQVQRTRRYKGHRPLIDVPNPEEKLIELNEQRARLYEEIADVSFCTDEMSTHNIAAEIAKLVIAKA